MAGNGGKSLEKDGQKDEIERLQKALERRDEFLSIASHELRLPIASLKLHLEMIHSAIDMGQVLPEGELSRTIRNSLLQVERLAVLVDDLLDISKIKAGHFFVRIKSVDLTDLTKGIVERFCEKHLIQKSQVSVRAKEPVQCDCDRFRIEQVILNLLSNAEKFGNGKSIQVEVDSDEQNAYITVTDEGPGIAQDDHERIFQRFERGKEFRSTDGLGLGLYISREIARAHQGEITVVSELEHGSSFTIRLPLVQNSPDPE